MRIAGSHFLAAGVIAGPLAERAFVDEIVRMTKPSNAISACAGIGRPVFGPANTSTGSPSRPAGGVVFVLAVGDFDAGHHEERRMHAAHDGDRARLSELVPAPHDQIAVLALRRHDRSDVPALRLHAVGAVIDPSGVGMPHHDHAAGADVMAAVVLVPFRRRDFQDVDVVAGREVLHHRAAARP